MALNANPGKLWGFIIKAVIILLIFIVLVPLNFIGIINRFYGRYIYTDIGELPETRVAIVFGAGLTENGAQPGGILQDRILTAVDLYKSGKVDKILMSGDNRTIDYNEPQVMINYARENGVSTFDLQGDFAGRRTYDTCYRAKYIFGVEKAVLITQDFHLSRALYICNSLGVESIGYSADKSRYLNQEFFAFRDLAATILAYWELHITPPSVVLGEKINF